MIPSFQDARKKKSTCIGSKTPGEPDTLFTGKLKGRGPPGFWEYLNSFQEPARAIQIPDSATRPGFWNLDRFQDPDIAVQNPNYAPLPAIWKLEDKIQIPNSEAAVSVYAPALSLHRISRVRRERYGDWGCGRRSGAGRVTALYH
jgi:hypothetical protein